MTPNKSIDYTARYWVYADRKDKDIKNFWNHVVFHPTDAMEDDWGMEVLERIHKDKAAKTIRIYSMFEEMVAEMERFQRPGKRGLFSKKPTEENGLVTWMRNKQGSCYICNKLAYNMDRYYATFYQLIKEGEFRTKVENSKGFCMRHFLALMEKAPTELPNGQIDWFYDTVFTLMRSNLARVKGDLDWFVEKFDYRNASADWKNSRDAVSRTMQKLQGIYPADPPYKSEPR